MSTRRNPRGPIAAAALVALVVCAAPGQAALVWDLSLGGGVVRDDNLHFDPQTPAEQGLRQPVSETVTTISPGAKASWQADRDRLRLDYVGEYQRFSGDEEQDDLWVHALSADLDWRRWAPFYLEVRERRERVPRSQQREVEAVIDQIDRNRLQARAGLGRELGARGVVELGYRGELENYPGVADVDRVLRQFAEGLWRYRWAPLVQSEVRAAYGLVERDLSSDYTEARASVAIEQRLSERVNLRYGLGWVREEDDEPGELEPAPEEWVAETRSSLLASAALSGSLARGGAWRLLYADTLQGLPEGDTLKTRRVSADVTARTRLGSYLRAEGWHEAREYRDSGREEFAWSPVVSARWMIAPWLAGELAGSWTNTTIREPEADEIDDDTARFAAGLVALLYQRLTLEVGYGHRKNDSSDALRSYTSNVVYGMLTFYYHPVPGGRLPVSYASRMVTSPEDQPGRSAASGAMFVDAGR